MRPSEALQTKREEIRRIVAAHRASNPRVFGSAAFEEDGEDSDLDLLIDPSPEMTYFDIGAIIHELTTLLGVPVEVVTPGGLPESFRREVIQEAIPV
jgi:uncharacterized protein